MLYLPPFIEALTPEAFRQEASLEARAMTLPREVSGELEVEGRKLGVLIDREADNTYTFYGYHHSGYEYLFYCFFGVDLLHVAYSRGGLPKNPYADFPASFPLKLLRATPWRHSFVRRKHRRAYRHPTFLGRAGRAVLSWDDLESAGRFMKTHDAP